MDEQSRKFYNAQLQQLNGCEIVETGVNDVGEVYMILKGEELAQRARAADLDAVTSDDHVTVWLMRDPEGNGPGYVHGLPRPEGF